MKQPPTAMIYVRVSSERQAQDGTSLDSQEDLCRAYCAREGIAVVGVERDIQSGAGMERRGLRRALDAIRAGEANVLLVYAYDRLSRNQNHQAVLLYEVEEQQGGQVLSVTEPRDSSPMGTITRALGAFVAQQEREKIKERTQRGVRQRALRGAIVSALPLYGYRWNEAHTAYVLDPATAPTVARIFAEASAGRSCFTIADTLTREGVMTPSQRQQQHGANGKRAVSDHWSAETVRHMLRSPTYKGAPVAYRMTHVQSRVKDSETGRMRSVTRQRPHPAPVPLASDGSAAPAIPGVTPAVWQAANDALARHRLEAPRHNPNAASFLLRTGFVTCGHCGRAAHVKRNGRGDYRYRCASRSGMGRGECAGNGPSIKCETLDTDIWNKALVLLSTDAIAQALLARAEGSGQGMGADGLQARLSGYDGAIAQLTTRRRTMRKQQEQAADDEEFDEIAGRIQEASERLHALQAERAALGEQMAQWTANQEAIKPLLERLAHAGEVTSDGVAVGVVQGSSESDAHVRVRVRLPADSPTPGQPGYEDALVDALSRYEATQRETAVARMAGDLTTEEKRALLRWLGVRVQLYRRRGDEDGDAADGGAASAASETQPAGEQPGETGENGAHGVYWTLTLDSPLGDGPFPLQQYLSASAIIAALDGRTPV